jgi:hypothetical protein
MIELSLVVDTTTSDSIVSFWQARNILNGEPVTVDDQEAAGDMTALASVCL